jgi:hypothetical protein
MNLRKTAWILKDGVYQGTFKELFEDSHLSIRHNRC